MFIPFAVAQSENPDHVKHIQQDPASHQESSGPLAPLQQALQKSPLKAKTKAEKNPENPVVSPGSIKLPQKMPMAPAGGMGGGGMMAMMTEMMGMMGSMAPKSTASNLQASSELPGFAGASHIYHIGATGFYVDHADMLGFTTEQLGSLNRLKEKSLLAQSALDRKVLAAEEDLWKLTASDKPVIKSIEAKVKEIESLKGEKRITFIRNVGEAAGLLTAEQRSILLGRNATSKKPAEALPDNMDGM